MTMKPTNAEPMLADIQMLLDCPKGEGMIVSCYADRSLDGYLSRWPQRLKNEAAGIVRHLSDDPDALREFAQNLAVIRKTLAASAARRARGMAVFSSTRRKFLQVFSLNVPVRGALVVDEQPYLVPLLEAMHRQRRYLVVLSDSGRGRIYAAGWGRADLLHEIVADVPRRHRSAGETWGKQQATIARHREDHILHYRKALVRLVQKAWSDAPYRGLILLGEDDSVAALRAVLPPPLARCVAYEAPYNWSGPRSGISAVVQRVLEQALHVHDEKLIHELERQIGARNHCVAVGAQEVVDALRNGQVGHPGYLILERDHGQPAARCAGCGAIFTDMRTVCPFCAAACDKVNLWQQILLFAARHNIPAHVVDDNPALHRLGGVAAMLSREGPWDAVAPAVKVEKRLHPSCR
jgi:peptide subunit release factor 1 (eRF1)